MEGQHRAIGNYIMTALNCGVIVNFRIISKSLFQLRMYVHLNILFVKTIVFSIFITHFFVVEVACLFSNIFYTYSFIYLFSF